MSASETVQAAQRLLADREIVGLAKYGATVDRTDLQAGDWLQHAIEEASDLFGRVACEPRPRAVRELPELEPGGRRVRVEPVVVLELVP